MSNLAGNLPRELQLRVERNGYLLAKQAAVATGIVARLVGLIGRDGMPDGTALVLPRCRRIHTFFMRFPIDLICVDAGWRVLCVRESIAPWHFGPRVAEAAFSIEFPPGALRKSAVEVGDVLVAELDI